MGFGLDETVYNCNYILSEITSSKICDLTSLSSLAFRLHVAIMSSTVLLLGVSWFLALLCSPLFCRLLSLSLMLRLTVSRPVCLGIEHPSGAYDQIFNTAGKLLVCWCGALSLTRTDLSFTIAAGPSQRSHSRVRAPWDSPYFTVSDLRLPFSSPPTTRRVTLEVFDPASTRVGLSFALFCLACYIRQSDGLEDILFKGSVSRVLCTGS
jgi:hypothetical protein